MYSKKITYTNYNGETKTDEFLFNISATEALEMES